APLRGLQRAARGAGRARVRASHRGPAGAVKRGGPDGESVRTGPQGDRLVVEHRAITRQSGDRRLAAAGGAREDPGVLTVHHGGGVEQHTALLHEEKAAQQAEQRGVEGGARPAAEAPTPPRDVAVGARRVAGKREVAVAPGREGPGWAPR